MNKRTNSRWKASLFRAGRPVGLVLGLVAGGLLTEAATGQSDSRGYRNTSTSARRGNLNSSNEREQEAAGDTMVRIATQAQTSYYYDGTDEGASPSSSPREVSRKPVAEEARRTPIEEPRRTPTVATRPAANPTPAYSSGSRKTVDVRENDVTPERVGSERVQAERAPAERAGSTLPTPSAKRPESSPKVSVYTPAKEMSSENERSENDRWTAKTSSRRAIGERNQKDAGIRLVSATEPVAANEVIYEDETLDGVPVKGPMWKAGPVNGDANAAQPPAARIVPDVLSSTPFETIGETGEWKVVLRRSMLLRTNMNIYRTAVVDPSVCDIVQYTPQEISIIGKAIGATHVTFWFDGDKQRPMTYLVRVTPDPETAKRIQGEFKLFEKVLTDLFPDSKVYLIPVADKLIVKGQCKDSEEAAQIMSLIRGETGNSGGGGNRGRFGFGNRNSGYGGNFGYGEGLAAEPVPGAEKDRRLPASQIVNMLRVPGVQQVALRVKIAELNRTAARQFGADLDMNFDVGKNGSLLLQSMLTAASGGTGSILGRFDGDKINFGIHFLETYGVVRVLSEPTLVTMSGRPASFVAGGEFAVPTTVGVNGVGAVTTDFRAFGAIINFLPTVLDKDRIRLEVSPEFSKINSSLTTNGTPGLDTRSVSTTVEMREGQTFAIAGLLDDGMKYDQSVTYPIPILRDIFGKRNGSRNETELMILVTPELVHPMDPEEVPPLPGFDVTEPTHTEFYLQGKLEGRPTRETRTTVWPRLRHRYQGTSGIMISGPFGHGQ